MTPAEKHLQRHAARVKKQKAVQEAQTPAPPAVIAPVQAPRTPAQRHVARAQARAQSSPSTPVLVNANPWEAIDKAYAGLRGLDATARVERKKALLEQFLPRVLPLLEAQSQGSQESSRVLVWLGDVGRMDEFWRLSAEAMALGWPGPFKTDWPVFRLDCVRQWAEKQLEAEGDPGAFVDLAIEALEQTEKAPFQLKAKLFKLAGQLALGKSAFAEAQTWFKKALEYDPNCGCKGLLKKAQTGAEPLVPGDPPSAPHGQAVRQAWQGG